MARLTVEDSVEAVDGNRFALVMLATRRARQLMAGAVSRIGAEKDKPTVQSLREIAEGQVKFDRSLRDALAGKFAPKERPYVLKAARQPRE